MEKENQKLDIEKNISILEWSEKSKKFLGEEIIQEIQEIYNSLIQSDKLDKTFFENIDKISSKLIDRIIRFCFKDGTNEKNLLFKQELKLKKDIFDLIEEISTNLTPDNYKQMVGLSNVSISRILNTIDVFIKSYLVSILAKWRKTKLKKCKNSQKFYNFFGLELIGHLKVENEIQQLDSDRTIEFIANYYCFLQMEEFFKDFPIDLFQDGETLKQYNQIIINTIRENQARGLPMLVTEDVLFSNKKVVTQFNDVINFKADTFAIINLFDKEFFSKLEQEKLKELATTNVKNDCLMVPRLLNDKFTNFKITNSNMEIGKTGISPSSLKLFLHRKEDGDDRVYEAIRFHILLKIAEMTVDYSVLKSALDEFIELPEPTFSEGEKRPREFSENCPRKKIPSRYYPRLLIHAPKEKEGIVSEEEEKKITINDRVYHCRLLPVGYRPSLEAIGMAQGKLKLGQGVQMPDGIVFKADIIEGESREYNISEEEYIQSLVKMGGKIRHYTFVREFKRPGFEQKTLAKGLFGSKFIEKETNSIKGSIGELDLPLNK